MALQIDGVQEGDAAAPTPEPGGVADAGERSQPDPRESARVEDRDGKRAHQPAPRDIDREALDALDSGDSPDDFRKALTEADPSSDSDHAGAIGAGAGEKKQPVTRSTPASPSATVQGERDAAYAGLKDKSFQALSQTHLLPDPESWKNMPPLVRANLVHSAKTILRERTKNYQASQAIRNQQNNAGAAAAVDDEQDDPNVVPPLPSSNREPPAAGAAASANAPGTRQGVRAPSPNQQQQQPPANASAAAASGTQQQQGQGQADSTEIDQAIQALEEQFGEGAAGPLRTVLQSLHGKTSQQLAALQEQLANRQPDPATQYVLQQQIRGEERSARTQLNDLAGATLSDEQWQQITTNAKVYAQAAFSSGQSFTWEDSLVQAGRAVLQPNLQQNAQRALANRRRDSLRGSTERGTTVARPERALSQGDRDRLALEKLDAGFRPDDVRAELF